MSIINSNDGLLSLFLNITHGGFNLLIDKRKA